MIIPVGAALSVYTYMLLVNILGIIALASLFYTARSENATGISPALQNIFSRAF